MQRLHVDEILVAFHPRRPIAFVAHRFLAFSFHAANEARQRGMRAAPLMEDFRHLRHIREIPHAVSGRKEPLLHTSSSCEFRKKRRGAPFLEALRKGLQKKTVLNPLGEPRPNGFERSTEQTRCLRRRQKAAVFRRFHSPQHGEHIPCRFVRINVVAVAAPQNAKPSSGKSLYHGFRGPTIPHQNRDVRGLERPIIQRGAACQQLRHIFGGPLGFHRVARPGGRTAPRRIGFPNFKHRERHSVLHQRRFCRLTFHGAETNGLR